MHDASFLRELLLVIALATAGAALFERLRLPTIAGYLIMGALVGPGALGFAPDPERARALAEFGVVFLLFEIGLELPLEGLRRSARSAVLGGGLQMALTLLVVGGALALGGAALPQAIVLGGLVAMSSTALAMRLLADRAEVDAPHGRLSVGVLLFQDLCVVPFLIGLPILAGAVPLEATSLAREGARIAVALGAVALLSIFVLPRVLDVVARLRSRELFSLVSFLLAVGSAVAAEALGLTHAVGAFAAGLVLGASPYAPQLTAEIAPLRGVLLGIFFTAVGMLFDASEALRLWPQVLLFVVAVIPLKAAIVLGIALFVLRESPRTGILAGLALATTGEFSFLLAASASEAGLLAHDPLQVFLAGSLVSLVATPFLLAAAPGWIERWAARPAVPARAAPTEGAPPGSDVPVGAAHGHVVVIGFGITGRTLTRTLKLSGIPFHVVEGNARAVATARRAGEPIVFGDATRLSVLRHVHPEAARLVAIAISDPLATRAVVRLVRSLAPRVPIIARTRYVAEADALHRAGATLVVAEEFEATLDLVSASLREVGVPSEGVARLADELRSEGYELLRAPALLALDPWLGDVLREGSPEWVVVPAGPAAGRTIAELDVRARTGATVVAHARGSATRINPPPDQRLEAGDRLLVLASADAGPRVRQLLSEGS